MKSWRLLLILLIAFEAKSQVFEEFSVEIEEVNYIDIPALQSYAFAVYDDYWFLMGGRTDGLHEHMPPFAFPESGENNFIYIVSPETKEVWAASVSSLPDNISEQLGATNMEFFQQDSTLFLIGGYGFSAAASDHITFPNLMAIQLNGLAEVVMTDGDMTPLFRQIEDNRMAVTGGHLGMMEDVFVLAGGQKFDGRYNPHGGASFTQEYTDAIRYFEITDDGGSFAIDNYTEWVDESLFHKRDYNMLPQIDPDGNVYYTMFSGVFRPDIDLPWLESTHVGTDWVSTIPVATQLLNQYHAACLPIIAEEPYAMHTVFFGGIGMYYYEEETLFIDSLVPFTKNISRMTRHGDAFTEYKMEAEMPAFLGASAEFIPNTTAPYTPEGILLLEELPIGTTEVGYIAGGIESEFRNIFMLTGNSWASDRIFKVSIVRTGVLSTGQIPNNGMPALYPNPVSKDLHIEWPFEGEWMCTVLNSVGESVYSSTYTVKNADLPMAFLSEGAYWIKCQNASVQHVQQVVKN